MAKITTDRISKLHEGLIKTAEEAHKDIVKFEGGNKSAGIRIRAKMQDVRDHAKRIRAEIQELKRLRKSVKGKDA